MSNYNKLINLKPRFNLNELLDTSTWIMTNTIKYTSDQPSDYNKLSIFDALYMLSIYKIPIIRKKSMGRIIKVFKPLNEIDNLNKGKLDKLKKCYDLINNKKYVLNPHLMNSSIYPELFTLKKQNGSKLKSAILSGGKSSSIRNEIIASINTLKINNMIGGVNSYSSNLEDTKKLLKLIENNYNINKTDKERLDVIMHKHSIYTQKLNNINRKLKDTLYNKKTSMDIFEKTVVKQKKNKNKLVNSLEKLLGIKRKPSYYKVNDLYVKDLSFNHITSIIGNVFEMTKSQDKAENTKSELETSNYHLKDITNLSAGISDINKLLTDINNFF
tara:strand:+ start:2322 stop:3308 length:987 start_codon:yes stop_codon:yes gene_type:complete